MSAAFATGLAFAQVLGLPQKMSYGADEYARVQAGLYPLFAYVGAALEVLAIVLAVMLIAFVRHDRSVFRQTVIGAVLLAGASAMGGRRPGCECQDG